MCAGSMYREGNAYAHAKLWMYVLVCRQMGDLRESSLQLQACCQDRPSPCQPCPVIARARARTHTQHHSCCTHLHGCDGIVHGVRVHHAQQHPDHILAPAATHRFKCGWVHVHVCTCCGGRGLCGCTRARLVLQMLCSSQRQGKQSTRQSAGCKISLVVVVVVQEHLVCGWCLELEAMAAWGRYRCACGCSCQQVHVHVLLRPTRTGHMGGTSKSTVADGCMPLPPCAHMLLAGCTHIFSTAGAFSITLEFPSSRRAAHTPARLRCETPA